MRGWTWIAFVLVLATGEAAAIDPPWAAQGAQPPGSEAEARALVARFLDPAADRAALSATLRPSSADYRAVYKEPLAGRLEAKLGPIWDQGGASIGPKAGQTEMRIVYATTDRLIAGDPVLKELPGGYERVRAQLNPGFPIVAFKFTAPGESAGMAFNGLVHVGGRWVLIPSPWRALE